MRKAELLPTRYCEAGYGPEVVNCHSVLSYFVEKKEVIL